MLEARKTVNQPFWIKRQDLFQINKRYIWQVHITALSERFTLPASLDRTRDEFHVQTNSRYRYTHFLCFSIFIYKWQKNSHNQFSSNSSWEFYSITYPFLSTKFVLSLNANSRHEGHNFAKTLYATDTLSIISS